jgi:hypothetical protein
VVPVLPYRSGRLSVAWACSRAHARHILEQGAGEEGIALGDGLGQLLTAGGELERDATLVVTRAISQGLMR